MMESVDHLKHKSRFEVVEGFLRSWADQDVERSLAFVAPNVRYSDNIGDSTESYKGVWQGKNDLQRVMLMVAKHWTNLAMEPQHFRLRTEDSTLVQCRIEFVLLHKRSGEFMFGNNRFVARVEDGLISEIQVFHDAPMFRAFLRLIGSQRHDQQNANEQLVDSSACS